MAEVIFLPDSAAANGELAKRQALPYRLQDACPNCDKTITSRLDDGCSHYLHIGENTMGLSCHHCDNEWTVDITIKVTVELGHAGVGR